MSGILWIIIVGFVAGHHRAAAFARPEQSLWFHPDHGARHHRRIPRDLDRPGHRPLRPQSRRRLHHRDYRRAGGVVHLEQAGGQPRNLRSRQQVERLRLRLPSRASASLSTSRPGFRRDDWLDGPLRSRDAGRHPSGPTRRSCCWIAAWRENIPGGDILRGRGHLERHLGLDVVAHLGRRRCSPALLEPGRVDIAGADRVDAD